MKPQYRKYDNEIESTYPIFELQYYSRYIYTYDLFSISIKIKIILGQVSKEMESNILSAQDIVTYYTLRDSIFNKVLTSNYTVKDFNEKTDASQLYLLFSAKQFTPERRGFDALIENLDDVPEELVPIVRALQELHKTSLLSINNSYKRMDYISDTFRTELAYKTDWFFKFYKAKAAITDEMIDYFYNNATYKNNLTWYRSAMTSNYAKNLRGFVHEARLIKKQLNEMLENKKLSIVDYKEQTKLIEEAKIIGVYKNEEFKKKIEIKVEQNQLVLVLANGLKTNTYFTDNQTFYFNLGLKGEWSSDDTISFKTNLKGFFEPLIYTKIND